jgi:hypothetical protein
MSFTVTWKEEKAKKKARIEAIDQKIESEIESCKAEDLQKMLEARRKEKYEGVDTGDVLKVVANVAIVGVLIAFEMSHILNSKGTRFLKVL